MIKNISINKVKVTVGVSSQGNAEDQKACLPVFIGISFYFLDFV